MALPAQINVTLNFSSGATFGNPFILNDPINGIIGTGVLAEQNATALIVDLTDITRHISIRRGRNITRDTYEAGEATIRVYDQNGDFNPQNPSSPYYGKLTPLRKIRISATYSGTEYYLYSGYTTDYTYSYDQAEQVGYVDISASDAFRLFILAAVSTITGQAA